MNHLSKGQKAIKSRKIADKKGGRYEKNIINQRHFIDVDKCCRG